MPQSYSGYKLRSLAQIGVRASRPCCDSTQLGSPASAETAVAAISQTRMGRLLRHSRRVAAGILFIADLTAARAADRTIDPVELPVTVENRSTSVLCAEKDNIHLNFLSPVVRQFRIQAVHPAYIGTITSDRYQPDWTSCNMQYDTTFAANARRLTFWETPDFWLTGYTLKSFWRPNTVPFRVGNRVEQGFHVVQVWMRYRERAEEIMVLYPPDGYWRARPLPFADMRWTAYGSSFLIGPIEFEDRPIVALKEIVFDPEMRTFTLSFTRGGAAKVTLNLVDQERIVLDVKLEGTIPTNLPFASLSSMYTSEFNADAAKVAWRVKDGDSWNEAPIARFGGAEVTELWAGRTTPSRHNMSAPDIVFSRFSKDH
jgi:hypothetical protein